VKIFLTKRKITRCRILILLISTSKPRFLNLIQPLFSGIVWKTGNNGMMMAQNGADIFFPNGYTIDDYGKVDLPLIGEIELVGLTVDLAKRLIASKVTKYKIG
jgi:hypothetical protein